MYGTNARDAVMKSFGMAYSLTGLSAARQASSVLLEAFLFSKETMFCYAPTSVRSVRAQIREHQQDLQALTRYRVRHLPPRPLQDVPGPLASQDSIIS